MKWKNTHTAKFLTLKRINYESRLEIETVQGDSGKKGIKVNTQDTEYRISIGRVPVNNEKLQISEYDNKRMAENSKEKIEN